MNSQTCPKNGARVQPDPKMKNISWNIWRLINSYMGGSTDIKIDHWSSVITLDIQDADVSTLHANFKQTKPSNLELITNR